MSKQKAIRPKYQFLQEREELSLTPWNGKEELSRRALPTLPMKWHSQKWVEAALGSVKEHDFSQTFFHIKK